MKLTEMIHRMLRITPASTPRYRLEVSAETDTGLQREHNEDHLAFSLLDSNTAILAVVADGMGGHHGGAEASRRVVEELQSQATRLFDSAISSKALCDLICSANDRLYQFSRSHLGTPGMGTTVVALSIQQGMANYAFVGDSRLYRFRNGDCLQLSNDHTLVAQMVRDGLLTAEQAIDHPDRNVITRALGTSAQIEVETCLQALTIEIGDSYLLCSDGLYESLTTTDISQIIAAQSTAQACRQLIALANARGGDDNISALLVNVLPPDAITQSVPLTRT